MTTLAIEEAMERLQKAVDLAIECQQAEQTDNLRELCFDMHLESRALFNRLWDEHVSSKRRLLKKDKARIGRLMTLAISLTPDSTIKTTLIERATEFKKLFGQMTNKKMLRKKRK